MARRAMEFTALGILIGACVFSVLALNSSWATTELDFDEDSVDFGYAPLSFRASFDGDSSKMPYTNEGFEDAKRIGMVHWGGALFLVGTVLVAMTALLLEHRVLLDKKWLAGATTLAGGVAVVVLITGLVLLPLGIAGMAQEPQVGLVTDGITWAFGLYAGIAGGALALAGTVLMAVAMLREAGFRLEPLETGAADFDE